MFYRPFSISLAIPHERGPGAGPSLPRASLIVEEKVREVLKIVDRGLRTNER